MQTDDRCSVALVFGSRGLNRRALESTMGLHVRVVAFLVVSCVVVGFGLGFLIGYLAFRDTLWIKSSGDIEHVVDETVSRRLLAEINPQKIKEHLR